MTAGGSPRVSIITACHNSARTLERTVLSVLNQTYGDIQYIVIDGLSSDGTLDVIKRHQDRLACWVSERDEGISDAWNKGLSMATGEIVGIINSDDYYQTDAAELAVKALEARPEAGFVFGDQLIIDQKGVVMTQKGDPNYLKTISFIMPSIPHSTVFMRRWVYEKYGGFDKNFKTAMDYELLLRITRSGVKGIYIPSVLSAMGLGGVSDRNYSHGYREVMKASMRYGYGKRRALGRFYYECAKTFSRKTFQQLGLNALVRFYRKYIGKRYKYSNGG